MFKDLLRIVSVIEIQIVVLVGAWILAQLMLNKGEK